MGLSRCIPNPSVSHGISQNHGISRLCAVAWCCTVWARLMLLRVRSWTTPSNVESVVEMSHQFATRSQFGANHLRSQASSLRSSQPRLLAATMARLVSVPPPGREPWWTYKLRPEGDEDHGKYPPKPCRRPSDGRDINIRPSRYGYHCYLYTLPSSGGTSKRGTPTYPHIHCLISSRQGSSARVGAPIMSSRRDPRSASRLQYHLARRTGLPPALLPRAGAVARGAMGSERHVRQRR